MNWVISTILGAALVATNIFPSYDSWLSRFVDNFKFGAISYPTSLDSFTNPGATDSVATVSHSAQHSNANDAIEALEAKLGISASTAVSDSFLVGNGAGSSIWSTYATGTQATFSGLGNFGSLISQASSTIVGGLTITGNSTTTNATSTIGAFTNFATTTNFYGAGLTTCSGGSFLTWSGGQFGCQAQSGGTNITRNFTTVAVGGTYYAMHSYSVVSGNTVEWEAACSRNATNETVTLRYRTSNDSASTTVSVAGPDTQPTTFAAFNATTTYTVYVDVLVGQGCDANGLQFRSRMYNP